jgi:hypothetical protein
VSSHLLLPDLFNRRGSMSVYPCDTQTFVPLRVDLIQPEGVLAYCFGNMNMTLGVQKSNFLVLT